MHGHPASRASTRLDYLKVTNVEVVAEHELALAEGTPIVLFYLHTPCPFDLIVLIEKLRTTKRSTHILLLLEKVS